MTLVSFPKRSKHVKYGYEVAQIHIHIYTGMECAHTEVEHKILPHIVIQAIHIPNTTHTEQQDVIFAFYFLPLVRAHVAIKMDRKIANHRVVKENTTNEMSTH